MLKALILAGPSASGKTSVAEEILRRYHDFALVRSVTTRKRRGDGHDSEYLYLSKRDFKKELALGNIVEYTEFQDHIYGTPITELRIIANNDQVPIMILDINGVRSVLERVKINACVVYIYDDIRVLDERLYERYVKADPTPEGLTKYVARKEQNIADSLGISEHADLFYTFVKGGATVSETTDEVLDDARSFFNGEPRKEDKIKAGIEYMRRSVESLGEEMLK